MSANVGKRRATRKSRVAYRWKTWKAETGHWYTSVWASNKEQVFDGSRGYSRKIDARRSVQNLIAAIRDGRIEEAE